MRFSPPHQGDTPRPLRAGAVGDARIRDVVEMRAGGEFYFPVASAAENLSRAPSGAILSDNIGMAAMGAEGTARKLVCVNAWRSTIASVHLTARRDGQSDEWRKSNEAAGEHKRHGCRELLSLTASVAGEIPASSTNLSAKLCKKSPRLPWRGWGRMQVFNPVALTLFPTSGVESRHAASAGEAMPDCQRTVELHQSRISARPRWKFNLQST